MHRILLPQEPNRNDKMLMGALAILALTALAYTLALTGCRDYQPPTTGTSSKEQALPCKVGNAVRFPASPDDFNRLYGNRGFYTDGNHLGRDMALGEGTAIHPVACGVVRVFRPAQGYGTLAVAVEHEFYSPRAARNGLGSTVTVKRFISIYGHLRPSANRNGTGALAVREGDSVGPDDVIGYVQNDAENGDGAEHLHLGIRLQSLAEAQRTDTDWFRGYDTTPSQRQWFADPADFLPELMTNGRVVNWHPAGTVLTRRDHPIERFAVGPDEQLHVIVPTAALSDNLLNRVIPVSDDEYLCYRLGDPYQAQLMDHHLLKFDDGPAVYEYTDTPASQRWVFISAEAFSSWGWGFDQITLQPANQRPAFFARYADQGFRQMRDGSLAKARGSSEVAVVSNGRRLPIFDWPTFLAMGYQQDGIVELDAAVMDAVAYPRGPLITPELASYCAHESSCRPDECDAGTPGNDMAAPPDSSLPAFADASVSRLIRDSSTPPPDMTSPPVKQPEICNGLDDDGNGQIDEIFLCPLGKRGPTCVTSCGANGFRVCAAPNCDWSVECHAYAESCDNTIDDDCDGLTDCADPDCQNDPVCQPKPDLANPPSFDGASAPDMAAPPDFRLPPPDSSPPPPSTRYEFRVLDSAGFGATDPFYLFAAGWIRQICRNTGTDSMQTMADGWRRCDLDAPITPFVGNFFSSLHPDWGFLGFLATVGSSPKHCTPTAGVEWRLTDLVSGRQWNGPAAGLTCATVNNYDFHLLPAF